jgi:hypothetical protein
MTIDLKTKRTLYNWVMDNIITQDTLKKLVNDGKVPRDKMKVQLVSYGDLQKWGVVI